MCVCKLCPAGALGHEGQSPHEGSALAIGSIGAHGLTLRGMLGCHGKACVIKDQRLVSRDTTSKDAVKITPELPMTRRRICTHSALVAAESDINIVASLLAHVRQNVPEAGGSSDMHLPACSGMK